jgi:hypothetical protein
MQKSTEPLRLNDDTSRAAVMGMIVTLSALLLSTQTASAQQQGTDRDAAPRACAQIQDDTDRLDCYDGVFRRAEDRAAATPATREQQRASRPIEGAVRTAPRPTATPTPQTADAASNAPAAGARAEPERIPIVVVALRETRGRNIVFTTDDGNVWIQTDGRSNYYPNVPFQAALRPGAMSSYFLVPNERGRAVRVRRGN